ncbi:response regulator [Bosea sp. LjRoot9]|uniref:response regulator n=1 Tax=Bosea sp. LjRoot9 TaxID=3342341 RepID=UPI003ED0C83A
MVDEAVSGDALLWHWSGRANEITWAVPASLKRAADASRLRKGDAQVRLHDRTISTLSQLAQSAARDNSAFAGHIAAGPAFLALDGAAVFGRSIGPLEAAGAAFPDQLARDGRSDALSRALIEGMEALPEAFVLYDADDRMLICNAQYKRLYPAVADLMKPGLYFPDLVRESVRRGVFKISDDEDNWVERRISFHRTGIGFFEQQLADGRWIQVSERRTPSGGTTSIRADITVLKARERDLRAARARAEAEIAMRTQFITKVGHELRNPLNVIYGIAQLLAEETMPKRHQAMIQNLVGASRAMRDVLNDILDIASITSGRVAIQCEIVESHPLLQEIAGLARSMAKQKGLTFHARISPDSLMPIWSDPRRLRQIFFNLLSNAFKYTSSGAISLRASIRHNARGGPVLRVTITDSGPGIDKDRSRRPFAPYGRHKDHVASGIEGLGLGLAISEELAEAIGAQLGLAPGRHRGTRAWVDVPLANLGEMHQPETPVASHAIIRAGGPPLDVLVVDDEQINLIVAEALLKRLGHRVTTALDGRAGIAALEQRSYDAVLLDISMQDMSGIDVARWIVNARPREGRPAIIAMTGNVLPADIETYFAAGFTGFVEKPVALEQLAETLTATRDFARGIGVLQPKDRLRFSERADSLGDFDTSRLDRMVGDIGPENVQAIVVAGTATFRQAAEALAQPSGDEGELGKLMHKVHAAAGLFGFHELSDRTLHPIADADGVLLQRQSRLLIDCLTDAIARMVDYASRLDERPVLLT